MSSIGNIFIYDVDTILTKDDFLKVHIMDTGGGSRAFTLPSARKVDIGQWMILVKRGSGNALKLYAGPGDRVLGSSPGGYIKCVDTDDYSSIKLLVIADGQWVAESYGIWKVH
jgi:hypothetical protein